jgi:hypothetical protein
LPLKTLATYAVPDSRLGPPAPEPISKLVAGGINIAGIAQILHLAHRNSELESDNSDLDSENARLRSEDRTTKRQAPKPVTGAPMDICDGGAAQKAVSVGLTPGLSPLA